MSPSARCASRFGGIRGKHIGIPPPAQFLDGRHVNRSVMQEILDVGEVLREKAPVGADGIPT
jgi:hypothetical protein